MQIIKLVTEHNQSLSESFVKEFIYGNFPDEMIRGLEYDDPKAITRALKWLGLEDKIKFTEPTMKDLEEGILDWESRYDDKAG